MSLDTKHVAVDITATQLHAASAWNSRRSRTIYNGGPNTIYIGGDNTVTTATGFPIPSGASLTIDKDPADGVFAICSVLQVSPADTRILAESQSS